MENLMKNFWRNRKKDLCILGDAVLMLLNGIAQIAARNLRQKTSDVYLSGIICAGH